MSPYFVHPPPFQCVVCMGGPFPSPPPPGVSILRPAFWGVCARDRDYNSSLEGDGLGWSASSLRIPAGIGKAVTLLTLTFPGGGERGAPLAWSPAGPDTVGRMRSVVLPCRGEVGGGGVGKRLLKTSSPLFPLLFPKAQAESAHCPRAVVSFRGSFCKGAGLHGRSRTSLVGWG